MLKKSEAEYSVQYLDEFNRRHESMSQGIIDMTERNLELQKATVELEREIENLNEVV